MSGQGTRYFRVRYYAESEEEAIRMIASKCEHYILICHNRCVWTEDSEEHQKGDIKKPHYHAVIYRHSWSTIAQTKKSFEKDYPRKGWRVEYCDNVKGAVQYLTHTTAKAIEEGKVRYEESELRANDDFFENLEERQKERENEKRDWTVEVLELAIEGKFDRKAFKKYASEFGRDFILNANKVITLAKQLYNLEEDDNVITCWDKGRSEIRDKRKWEELKAEQRETYRELENAIEKTRMRPSTMQMSFLNNEDNPFLDS